MPLSATVLGEGRPIVLLPGFALDSSVMAMACEPAFTDTRWQRIYLDLPGTGGSPAGEPTSEAVLADVQKSIADRVGDTRYLLVGHSYGGYLATGLTRRDPARVAGLLMICAGLRIRPTDRDLSAVLPSTPEAGWLDSVPEDLREHFGQAIGYQTRATADRIAAALSRRGPLDEDYLGALRPAGYQLDDEEDPSSFTGPVSLLAGRRDRIAGFRDQFAALARYPHGNFTALAESGHYLPFEQPEAFARSVREWLTSIPEERPAKVG